MKIRSLRARLLLTYSGAALLTAAVIGFALLSILKDFYQRRENAYLQRSATTVSSSLLMNLVDPAAAANLDDFLTAWSFLTQTRLRLLDQNGEVLADTGNRPDGSYLISSMVGSTQTKTGIFTTVSQSSITLTLPDQVSGGQNAGVVLPLAYTYNFSLFGEPVQSNVHSEQVYSQRITLPITQNVMTLELSQGPAYGKEVIDSVFWGWLFASFIAMIIAGLAGRFASRQISAPLVSLTAAAGQIAEGDLSARTSLRRSDEIGTLSITFDSMAMRMETMISGLKRFVSDAAHEIQTPLTALQTNLELALNETDPTRKDAVIQRAQMVAVRLSSLTSNLLDLARLEAQGQQLQTEPIDLAGLAADLVETYSSRAEQAGLNCISALPDAPVWISANRQALILAVNNLFENALKFTPRDGTITLRIILDSSTARLSVEDTGIGIPEGELTKIFERFHRAPNSSGTSGSGLGLAICKTIVEAHGGTLTAQNLTTGGAGFTMTFPLMSK